MARSNQYDELEEMSVSGAQPMEDDIRVGRQQKQKQPKKTNKTPYQLEKEAEQRRSRIRIIAIIVAAFVLILGALIAVGVAFTPEEHKIVKGVRDEERGYFYNSKNLPEMDPSGVKGMVKEVYFTTDGNLAVTLNLSNGTSSEHEVVRVAATLVNESNETIARQTLDTTDFQKSYKVPGNGRSEMYFEIDESNILLPNDDLDQVGSTLEIGSTPLDGVMPEVQQEGAVVGDGPKDIAEGRSYYENTANMPEFATDGLRASIIRARYTNDGSLVLDFSVSNGTNADYTLDKMNILMQNVDMKTIVQHELTDLAAQNIVIAAQSYDEVQLIVDTANVQIKDDDLATLTCQVTATGITQQVVEVTEPVTDETVTTAAEDVSEDTQAAA